MGLQYESTTFILQLSASGELLGLGTLTDTQAAFPIQTSSCNLPWLRSRCYLNRLAHGTAKCDPVDTDQFLGRDKGFS